MRKIVLCAALVVAATASACKSVGRNAFAEPVVTLKDVKLQGIGLQGGSLDVELSVYNPNEFRLDATRLTYKVLVDTVNFAVGSLDQRWTVQDRDSTTVRIPVTFTYAGVGEAGRQLINTGTVNYRVLGDVTVGTPLGNFTVPYDRTGRFSTVSGNR